MEITSYLLGKKAGGGSTPTGTIDITQNGITNVSGYATANVQVPEKQLEEKSVTISSNTTTLIEPSTGKDGMSSVSVTTNIPQPSGKITITQNGTDIDVSSYASADVNVGSSTPTTIAGWNQKLAGAFDEFINYTNNTLIGNRTAFTNNAITLYTPDANMTRYFINKWQNSQGNDRYIIYWYNGFLGNRNTNSSVYYSWTFPAANDEKFQISNWSVNGIGWKIQARPEIYWYSPARLSYYASGAYSSMEELVNAVKNNEAIYTNHSNVYIQDVSNIAYSNDCLIHQGETEKDFNFLAIDGVISHNETITTA